MVGIKAPEQANPSLNLGIFQEAMSSQKQLDFLKATQPETIKHVKYNDQEQGNMDVGRGTLTIPNTKDFWVGDPL